MESGSSGSFQSSSAGVGGGGDEEHESSRGDSISSFLNSHQRNPFFHPPSCQNSQNLHIPLLLENTNFKHHQYDNNEQTGWSRGYIRSSKGNYGNLGNFSSLPSSSCQPLIVGTQNPLADSLLQSSGGSGGGEKAIYNPTTGANQPPPPPPQEVVSTKSTNPKKRTRASRKAPTTVLTTDTTNFRQMVQEFTGIPAPPFSTNPGGSALGRRLNIFSSAGAAFVRGGHQLDHMGSFYPLRPSAQRLTNNPNSLLSNNPNSNIATISNNTLGLPQHLKQPHPHQNVLSMQNQLLNFQPPVQSSLSPSIFNTATRPHHHQESSNMNNNPPSLDELGSFLNQQRASGEVGRQSSWRDDQGGGNLNNEGQDGQHQLGTFDGNVTQHDSNINSGFKLNSSSSSDFNPEKVLDNASSSAGVEFTNYK